MRNLTQVQGNALTALKAGKVDAVLHVCNSHGIMGSGMAKQVRLTFPDAYTAYRATMDQHNRLTMGSVSTASGIYNLVAQENYGRDGKRYIDYGMLAVAVSKVFSMLPKEQNHIAIPFRMGSDLAGGDWQTVLEIVLGFCIQFDVHLSVYTLPGYSNVT